MQWHRQLKTSNQATPIPPGWTPFLDTAGTSFGVFRWVMLLLLAVGAYFYLKHGAGHPLTRAVLVSLFPWGLLGVVVGVTLLHELTHLAFFPSAGWRNRTTFGFRRGRAFVSYAGSLRKSRAVLIALAPFVLLSITGAAWATWFPAPSWVVLAIFFNAVSSATDLLVTWHVLSRVPAGAHVAGFDDTFCWRLDRTWPGPAA